MEVQLSYHRLCSRPGIFFVFSPFRPSVLFHCIYMILPTSLSCSTKPHPVFRVLLLWSVSLQFWYIRVTSILIPSSLLFDIACFFAIYALVSTAYVTAGLTTVLNIRTFLSVVLYLSNIQQFLRLYSLVCELSLWFIIFKSISVYFELCCIGWLFTANSLPSIEDWDSRVVIGVRLAAIQTAPGCCVRFSM